MTKQILPTISQAKSPWAELKEQALLAFHSGLLPKSVRDEKQAVTIALMGKELGLGPMASLTGLYVVNGMVAMKGNLMLRLVYERVPGAKITVLTLPEKSNTECLVEMSRPGGNPQRFRFTLEDAKQAGFMNKAPWQQYTSTMLRWAAIRTGARIVFADALAGVYMDDEIPQKEVISVVEEPKLEQPTTPTPAVTPEPQPQLEPIPPEAEAAGLAVDALVEAAKKALDPHGEAEYCVPFGKFKGRTLTEINREELRSYVWFIEDKAGREGKEITGPVLEFITKANDHMGLKATHPQQP